jgi:hypothetical protein
VAHQQGLQTYGTLLETFGLQGDHEFALGMIAALMDPASYVANTGAKDKWLTKMDGSIVGTPGDPRHYRERYDIEGNIIPELVPGSNEQGSQAASLYDLFGEERIKERMGDDLYKIDNFDNQTLKDVLNWDDETIQKARLKGDSLNVDGDLKKRLLGEALLKKYGYTWDTTQRTWVGSGLNISDVPIHGNVGLAKQNNEYIPFTITSEWTRMINAFNLFKKEGVLWGLPNLDFINNTTSRFTYTDLRNGSQKIYTIDDPINSIDNMINEGGQNQEYHHLLLGIIQGATIARGSAELRLFNTGGQFDVPEAFLITNYRTIAGDWFGENGRRSGIINDPRSWVHPTANGG